MFYIKTSKVGEFAQLAADGQMHVNFMPSMQQGRTRVTGVEDSRLLNLAVELKALPDEDERWPGDTRQDLAPPEGR